MQTNERFKAAGWLPDENTPTSLIGGAGGIGSWLALLLARATFPTIIYDDDIVEIHNQGGQAFLNKDIGLYKVKAVQNLITDMTESSIRTSTSKIVEGAMSSRYSFSAFDNMVARKAMFENWLKDFKDTEDAIFIDGRLRAESMQILCVQGGNQEQIKEYQEEYLFDDNDVTDEQCSFKQTSHSAAMIASHMVAFFTNFIYNLRDESKPRQIPFYWEYVIPVNYTDVK